MWDDFAEDRASAYIGYKFTPTYRVGLTNFLREEAICEALSLKKEDVIADIGCAAGRQLLVMAKNIDSGVGVDIAQPFIDTAESEARNRQITNVKFYRSEIERLPLLDAAFDKVICAEVLEHVFDKEVALKELLRILKPGGLLLITVPNMNADATWWGRLMRRMGRRSFCSMERFSREELLKHGDAHVREFTGSSLATWLTGYGLTCTRPRSVSFLDGPWIDQILKIPLHVYPLRAAIIFLERMLSKTTILWGRHLVVLLKKS